MTAEGLESIFETLAMSRINGEASRRRRRSVLVVQCIYLVDYRHYSLNYRGVGVKRRYREGGFVLAYINLLSRERKKKSKIAKQVREKDQQWTNKETLFVC